jgi:four helix bundle protein
MKQNVIAEKSAAFAVRIVNLTRQLRKRKVESVLINQLLRCGTSIAANVHEATVAISKNEFSAKMSISLKEARETSFWIKVLFDTKTITDKEYFSLAQDSDELEKILFSIVKTSRLKNGGNDRNEESGE